MVPPVARQATCVGPGDAPVLAWSWTGATPAVASRRTLGTRRGSARTDVDDMANHQWQGTIPSPGRQPWYVAKPRQRGYGMSPARRDSVNAHDRNNTGRR